MSNENAPGGRPTSEPAPTQQKFKVLVIGDPFVGKTSLIRKYTENKFEKNYIPTIGVNLCKHTLALPAKPNDDQKRQAALIFWDIAGQQSFDKMHMAYFQGAHGVIMVFDVTDPESLDNVTHWREACEKYNVAGAACLLVGNKIDLKEDRKVQREAGETVARELGTTYHETSALTGENVSTIFREVYEAIVKKQ